LSSGARLALVLCCGLVALPAVAGGAPARRLLVTGDSLAVGVHTYLPRELRDWQVSHASEVGRHTREGVNLLRAYGRRLPRVIHVSLGTNDDPRRVADFTAAIRETMELAGDRRCVVWTNIVRPPVRGRDYGGYNRALARESQARDNLRVVDWARMVREHPAWLAADGVHASAEGYRERAQAVANAVRGCLG
jgi:GDSL-like Lipase/Acylhydrolase family